ncbi:MAG: hypothetical protein K0S78_482 [Thermomicrobiales bacterium]|nr:hypothetical protein [Thermomicrobiales bacterium]MDF3038884.1 hypothetical protein [Thermomicrobiales bacterium]
MVRRTTSVVMSARVALPSTIRWAAGASRNGRTSGAEAERIVFTVQTVSGNCITRTALRSRIAAQRAA